MARSSPTACRALDLDEPGAPLRVYIPAEDVDPNVLVPSSTHSTCPYKGVASYQTLKSANAEAKDAVWYYPDPCPLVEPIRDYFAFWGNQISYATAAA